MALSKFGQMKNYGDEVRVTKEACDITGEDDKATYRGKLKCGCVYSCDAMKLLAETAVGDGESSFLCGACKKAYIPYDVVRHVAGPDADLMREIEGSACTNYHSIDNVQLCPSCKMPIFWESAERHVRCPDCKADFCWRCARKWLGSPGGLDCQNARCAQENVQIKQLLTCPTKKIQGRDCPTMRACPRCGLMIEHIDACMQMDCPTCDHRFCMICLRPTYQCPYKRNPDCGLAARQTTIPRNVKEEKQVKVEVNEESPWCVIS